jgi:hypothetical protein
MLDGAVAFAAGSDFPVEDVRPTLGLFAATMRIDTEGNPPGGFLPDQRLTLDEAIAGFTSGAVPTPRSRSPGAGARSRGTSRISRSSIGRFTARPWT